ncbi:hypothetical protein C0431_08870 [bacterium]|jgi:clan AA aspartic protease (TIGR02281 family)|nr:hypothetical protein [bacterium]
MRDLAQFLHSHGYHEIQLTRSVVGHFHTRGTLNDREVEVLVDTGASCTCVAMSLVSELGLEHKEHEVSAGWAGGYLDQLVVEGANLRLGTFVPHPVSMAGLDFDQINAPLVAQGSAPVDIILGADVFDAHAAIIDCSAQCLFLR